MKKILFSLSLCIVFLGCKGPAKGDTPPAGATANELNQKEEFEVAGESHWSEANSKPIHMGAVEPPPPPPPGSKPEKEIGDFFLVDTFGNLNVSNPDIYAEDLTSIVGHVVEVISNDPNKIKYNVYSRSIVDSTKSLAAKAVIPINSSSQEIKATKTQIISGKLTFLDANISDDEYYTFSNQAILSLNLKDEYVNQNRLSFYDCSKDSSCKNYIVDWAQVRQIKTSKYKKSDKNVKVKNLPPFISAVFQGGEFSLVKENSDKQTITKLLVHIVPIKYWVH